MITTGKAIQIIAGHLSEILLSNTYYISETPQQSWNIYGLPPDFIYIGIRNQIIEGAHSGNSVAVAVDKNDGSIIYFGLANDEG